jgi:hypothetical protein
MANWVILSANVVLLLVLIWANRTGRPTAAMRSDAQLLGMHIYTQRDPIAVFVKKDFPSDRSVHFYRYEGPLLLTCDERATTDEQQVDEYAQNESRAPEEIMLCIRDDFSISCKCSYVNGVQISDIQVTRGEGGTFDLNADGFPDTRVTGATEPGHGKVEVWYDCQWREVTNFRKKDQRQLVGGGRVSFDRETGAWIPVSDANGGGSEEGTGEPKK